MNCLIHFIALEEVGKLEAITNQAFLSILPGNVLLEVGIPSVAFICLGLLHLGAF